jgi:hypothetical protein
MFAKTAKANLVKRNFIFKLDSPLKLQIVICTASYESDSFFHEFAV